MSEQNDTSVTGAKDWTAPVTEMGPPSGPDSVAR